MEDFLATEERVAQAMESLGPVVLGQRVRRARAREGLSIRDLAQRAHISATSVMRLERGLPCQPTTLVKVCAGMGLHLERFLEPTDEDGVAMVHHRADDRWYDFLKFAEGPLEGEDRPLSTEERHALAQTKNASPFLIFKTHLTNGRAFASLMEIYRSSPARSHPGEEFLYVLKGTLEIRVGATVHRLQEGECIAFWSSEDHVYAPAAESGLPVRLLCVRVAS